MYACKASTTEMWLGDCQFKVVISNIQSFGSVCDTCLKSRRGERKNKKKRKGRIHRDSILHSYLVIRFDGLLSVTRTLPILVSFRLGRSPGVGSQPQTWFHLAVSVKLGGLATVMTKSNYILGNKTIITPPCPHTRQQSTVAQLETAKPQAAGGWLSKSQEHGVRVYTDPFPGQLEDAFGPVLVTCSLKSSP